MDDLFSSSSNGVRPDKALDDPIVRPMPPPYRGYWTNRTDGALDRHQAVTEHVRNCRLCRDLDELVGFMAQDGRRFSGQRVRATIRTGSPRTERLGR